MPDEYLCPITREIMKDPVMGTGNNYLPLFLLYISQNIQNLDRSTFTNSVDLEQTAPEEQ